MFGLFDTSSGVNKGVYVVIDWEFSSGITIIGVRGVNKMLDLRTGLLNYFKDERYIIESYCSKVN